MDIITSSVDNRRGGSDSDPQEKYGDGGDAAPFMCTEDASARKERDHQEAVNHRADLAKIASMRNIAGGGGLGQRQSDKSPKNNEPRQRGRLSSPTTTIEVDTNEPPAEGAGQSGEVCSVVCAL